MSQFKLRGFISFLLTMTFVVVVTTGIVLWLSHSPETFGIGKGAWKHAHIFLSLVMLIAGIVHLSLNWSVLCSYLVTQGTKRVSQKRELALALAITVLVGATAFVGEHGDMQQFDRMTIEQIARQCGKPVDQLVDVLKKNGIEVHDPADSVQEVAQHNSQPSMAVIAVLHRNLPGIMGPRRGDH